MSKYRWTGFAQLICLAFVLPAAVLSTTAAFAQKVGHFDVSASAAEMFPKSSTGNGTTDTPTISFAQLGTFRYRRSFRNSIIANYGRTSQSQVYSVGENQFQVLGKVIEYSGAYVLNLFPEEKKFETFVLAGGGELSFVPGATFITTPFGQPGYSYQVPLHTVGQKEAAFLYGGGIDYPVRHHWALRMQYRGLLYRAPDFSGPGFFTGAHGHIAETAGGVVFRF
jgi:opacity protein-like surface antigen